MKYKVGDIVFSTIWKKSVLIKDIRPNRFYLIADLEYLSRTMITYESNLKSREDDIEKDMEEHQKIVDEIMTIQGIEPIEAEIEEVWHCPDGYIFKDENGNVINAQKIVLEKKPNDKLKLESTKKVREYWNEYTRIFIEIYDDEPNECILTHLLTLEGHRQKGYGKQALIQAEEIAKELGCHKAHLKVETNSWMHNWYLRCGYSWYKNANEGYTWLTKNL